MRVKITSDSTCDLSPELIDRFHIGILPMIITFGDTAHRDGVDITPEDIYRFVAESGTLPKTCAMNAAEYSDFSAGIRLTDQRWCISASAADFPPPARMPESLPKIRRMSLW